MVKRTVFIDKNTAETMTDESGKIGVALDDLWTRNMMGIEDVFAHGLTKTRWEKARLEYVSAYDRTRMVLTNIITKEKTSFCSADVLSVENSTITFLPTGAKV